MESCIASILRGIKPSLDVEAHSLVISSVTGSVVTEGSFMGLLRSAIAAALFETMRIDRVIDGLQQALKPTSTLVAVNTSLASSIAHWLGRMGKEVQVDRISGETLQCGPSSGQQDQDTKGTNDSSKIAIIGFSGRFPDADGLAEFWDVLQKGLDTRRPVPPDRFDWEAHYDATGKRKNTSKVKDGCWIRSPGMFDARFFHLSAREACQSDPAQRLALLTAYEALEMAGFVPDRTPSSRRTRVGVYYGTTSDDWREVNSGQDVDTYFIPGGNRAFIPGRINYFFKFSGPSVSVDTACSSSLAAINIAVTGLLNRDCDTAVAGGTNIMTNPDNFAGLDRGHFLSHTGNCQTFDDKADGYCRCRWYWDGYPQASV